MNSNFVQSIKKHKLAIGIIGFLIITAIPTVDFYNDLFFKEPPATQKDFEEFKKILIYQNFSDYNYVLKCENYTSPKIEDNSVFIDNCVLMSKQLNMNNDSIGIVTSFRSNWTKSENKIHYIFSVYNEINDISIFEENNIIKLKFISKGDEHILKLPLNEVKWQDGSYSKGWNIIRINLIATDNEVQLNVNGVEKIILLDFEINFSNSTIFLGSSNDNKYFAEGWFQGIAIYDPELVEYFNYFDDGILTTTEIQDAKFGSVWNQISFEGFVPPEGRVSLYANSSNDGTTWTGWQLVEYDAKPDEIYEIPYIYQKRYARMKLVSHTENPFSSPIISEFIINSSI